MKKNSKIGSGKSGNIFCLLVLFNCIFFHCYSQSKRLDSLSIALKTEKGDTSKVNTLNLIGWEFKGKNPDTAILICTQALNLAEKIFWQKGIATAQKNLGVFNRLKGNFPAALMHSEKALQIDEKLQDKKGICAISGNIGNIYYQQGAYTNALEYYFKALKIAEEIKDKKLLSTWLGSIGNIYDKQNEYDNALNYFFKALKIDEKGNDKGHISAWLSSIGRVYKSKASQNGLDKTTSDSLYHEALINYQRSLQLNEELGDKNSGSRNLDLIGNVYEAINDPRALDCYLKSLKYAQEIGDNDHIPSILKNTGSLYMDRGDKSMGASRQTNYKTSEKYMLKALKLDTELGSLSQIMDAENTLSLLYIKMNQYELALSHYKNYIVNRDSVFNQQNIKRLIQTEMQYQFDKKTVADSTKNFEQAKQETFKHNQEIKQQKIYTYGGVAGFALMLIVALVSFRAFKQKQKTNEIISRQKLFVDEKQKEILDSIHYAKRIQKSLLPTDKYIDKNLRRMIK